MDRVATEFIEHRGAQIVEQAMQGAAHMAENHIDRIADVFHAHLGKARLRKLQMGLDRSEVLAQFVMQLGSHMASLVFFCLQVATCSIAQLSGEMIESAIDRGKIDILFGHALTAAA